MIIKTIALAAGLALGAHAHAQPAPQDPARADAPVAPTTYVSPLAGYRAGPAATGTPAANWVASNAAVAGGGHAMHTMYAAPSAPAAPAKPAAHAGHDMAPPADPHAHHGHHGHHGHHEQNKPPAPVKEHQHEH
ncbi:hypothetical protein [Pseudoduganella chitinolytica]|uniref:Uncharacterized protein n=1 Tax=Pseudoduganella chitinolytica TaxID=34070 RepID=A0ABY8BGC8_9BURK|nr:hypothetical protein [Pseudoduganella chitinolytica]WEF34977.1 hypothetical protein PX653_09500 [Pseudoduganella chitinolytica]